MNYTVYKDEPSLGNEKFSNSKPQLDWTSASVHERDEKMGRSYESSVAPMSWKSEDNTRLEEAVTKSKILLKITYMEKAIRIPQHRKLSISDADRQVYGKGVSCQEAEAIP